MLQQTVTSISKTYNLPVNLVLASLCLTSTLTLNCNVISLSLSHATFQLAFIDMNDVIRNSNT